MAAVGIGNYDHPAVAVGDPSVSELALAYAGEKLERPELFAFRPLCLSLSFRSRMIT